MGKEATAPYAEAHHAAERPEITSYLDASGRAIWPTRRFEPDSEETHGVPGTANRLPELLDGFVVDSGDVELHYLNSTSCVCPAFKSISVGPSICWLLGGRSL